MVTMMIIEYATLAGVVILMLFAVRWEKAAREVDQQLWQLRTACQDFEVEIGALSRAIQNLGPQVEKAISELPKRRSRRIAATREGELQ